MSANWLPERLPEDIDCERSFLATCCAPGAGPGAQEAVAMVSGADFVHPGHRAVFMALQSLLSEGQEVNSLTLKVTLDASDTLSRVGGYSSLVDLLAGEDVERPAVLAGVILEKSRLRKLVHLGAQLVRDAAGEEDSSFNLVARASGHLVDLAQSTVRKGLIPLGEVGARALARVQEVAEGRRSPGVSTGFTRLDWMLGGGFKPKQSIVLAARPGIGKSTLLVQWMRQMAERSEAITPALYALEMGDEEIWTRTAGSEARVSGGQIATGTLAADEWQRLRAAADRLAVLPFLLCDQASITVPEIRAFTERAIIRYGALGLVGIDYLQLLSSPKGSNASRQNEATRVGEISRAVKIMAKDLDLPVILLSQLNREVEHRSGGRPQLSDLRDSGAVEQDADVVLFLHRRGEAGSADASFELIVAKNRNGPTGVIPLVPDLEHFRFSEMTRYTDSPSTPTGSRYEAGDGL